MSESVCACNGSTCTFLQSISVPIVGTTHSLPPQGCQAAPPQAKEGLCGDIWVIPWPTENWDSTRKPPFKGRLSGIPTFRRRAMPLNSGKRQLPQVVMSQEACSLRRVWKRLFCRLIWHQEMVLLADSNSCWRELAFTEPTLSCLPLYRVRTVKWQGEMLSNC